MILLSILGLSQKKCPFYETLISNRGSFHHDETVSPQSVSILRGRDDDLSSNRCVHFYDSDRPREEPTFYLQYFGGVSNLFLQTLLLKVYRSSLTVFYFRYVSSLKMLTGSYSSKLIQIKFSIHSYLFQIKVKSTFT